MLRLILFINIIQNEYGYSSIVVVDNRYFLVWSDQQMKLLVLSKSIVMVVLCIVAKTTFPSASQALIFFKIWHNFRLGILDSFKPRLKYVSMCQLLKFNVTVDVCQLVIWPAGISKNVKKILLCYCSCTVNNIMLRYAFFINRHKGIWI